MSINMANVKQIMHGTKEVAKIEDSLGRILWQKMTPVVRNKLYYVSGGNVSEYDFENKTITTYTPKSGSATPTVVGSFVFGYNGDLYASPSDRSTYCYKLEIDTVNREYNWTDMSATLPGINGNTSFKDGNDIIWTSGGSSSGNIYNWLDNQIIGTFGGSGKGSGGNNMLKYNNKIYNWGNYASGSHIFEYSNGTYTQTNIPVPGGSSPAYNVWFLNGTMYYMGTKEYNPNSNTWVSKSWSGGMGSFNGSRVFTDGIDVYQVGGTGTKTIIWKLNVATSTWSQYWTVPTAIRGDYFINSKGTAQLGQNLRPRN